MKKNKLSPLYIALERARKQAKIKEAFGQNVSNVLTSQILNEVQIKS